MVYKATKHGLLLYALVANDGEGHTWLIAFALMSWDMSEVLTRFLEIMKAHVDCEEEWAPTVMIEKDVTKRAAV